MSTRVVELANFMGGEFNLKGEIHSGAGSFTATNMVRLIDGSLAPRSGLVDLAPVSNVTGTVLGFGFHAATITAWWIIGNTVYQVSTASTAGTTTALTNTLAVTPTHRVRAAATTHSQSSWVAIYGDKVYDFNHVTPAVNALTGSPSALIAEVDGDRLLAANTSANPERIYFSAAADFTSWPAANYLDVGYGFGISVLSAFRQGVMINKQDHTWWLWSGTPGVNDVLRQLHRTTGPGATESALTRWGRSGDGKVWFLPFYGEFPVAASGASLQPFEYLSFNNSGNTDYFDAGLLPKLGVSGLVMPEDLCIAWGANSSALDNQALLLARGAWSKHTFAKNISGFMDGRLDAQRRMFFCDGGGASAKPKFYAWSYDLNRPPFSGRTWESKTDAGTSFTSTVTLPTFWVNEPGPVRLKAMSVEFQGWNCGFSGNNTFTVAVTPVLRDGSDQTTVTAPVYSKSEATYTSAGTVGNTTIDFSSLNTQEANGFRVAVSAVVGYAIRRLFLIFETHEAETDTDSA